MTALELASHLLESLDNKMNLHNLSEQDYLDTLEALKLKLSERIEEINK